MIDHSSKKWLKACLSLPIWRGSSLLKVIPTDARDIDMRHGGYGGGFAIDVSSI